jgi:hypothetical protein
MGSAWGGAVTAHEAFVLAPAHNPKVLPVRGAPKTFAKVERFDLS